MNGSFVPDDFDVPAMVDGPGFRLEPLGPEHNERDHTAWMGNMAFIHTLPGFRPGERTWPVPMTLEENLGDMEMHARHFRDRVGFTWSILGAGSSQAGDVRRGQALEVVGCLYVYPPSDEQRAAGHDAEVRSWVVESRADLDPPFRAWVAAWLADGWPFRNPFHHG